MHARTPGLGLTLAIGISSVGCASGGAEPAATSALSTSPSPTVWEVAADLRVKRLAREVWLHTSWCEIGDGIRFPSNGLLVRDGDELTLVDTAWDADLTNALLDWADDELGLGVRSAIVTHSHNDRMGGAAALTQRGIPFVGHPLTAQLATERDAAAPAPSALAALDLSRVASVGSVEVFYPGPGHTIDNVTVWLPESRVLFGGCAVKSLGSEGLGNIVDASLDQWPASLHRLIDRYAHARVVVPGHGAPGDVALLEHTLVLLEDHAAHANVDDAQ